MLFISGAYHHVDDVLHESEIGDSKGDGARRGIRSEEISHSSFYNDGKSVDGDGISGYMYQTINSTSHHFDDIGRLLGFIVMSTREVYIGLILANFIHITMVDTFPTQGSLKELFQ